MASNFYPSGSVLLLVGTTSGLFLLSSKDREHWELKETALKNANVYHAAFNTSGNYRLFATDNSNASGPMLRYSDDFGETWRQPRQGIQFPTVSNRKLKNIWLIQPGRSTEPNTLYAGTDEACLWTSHNNGETWEADAGLLYHPTREHWQPGAGGMCLHSIVPDYSNSQRMWVAISSVGCMRTENGGKSWEYVNKNIGAKHLPPPTPLFGNCAHRLIQHPQNPDTLYLQDHGGQYKTLTAGDEWIDIQNNLPSEFGFPIALDIHHPETVYTVVVSGYGRYNLNNQFTVYRSENSGQHWVELTKGLPGGEEVRLGVLRHALCADTCNPCGLYVGTNTGQLFASSNRGDSWQQIADYLPRIQSVTVTTIA